MTTRRRLEKPHPPPLDDEEAPSRDMLMPVAGSSMALAGLGIANIKAEKPAAIAKSRALIIGLVPFSVPANWLARIPLIVSNGCSETVNSSVDSALSTASPFEFDPLFQSFSHVEYSAVA
ncbi:MAG: hypothetical protein AAGF56_15205 [Pseudomonadota bacterium]